MNDLSEIVVALGLIALIVFLVRRSEGRFSPNIQYGINKNAPTRADIESSVRNAFNIVAAYGAVLENKSGPGFMFYPESELPYPKAKIRLAIELVLLGPVEKNKRTQVEVGDVLLNDFIPNEEYRIIHKQQAALSKSLEMHQAGERDAMKLANAMREGTTQEAQDLLEKVAERQKRDNLSTLERHKELRLKADRLGKS